MNLKVNKKAPILARGQYQAKITNYKELDTSKSVLTISVNGQLFPIWLDESKEITYKDLNGNTVTTSQAQMTFDSIVGQLNNNVLMQGAETFEEVIAILLMDTTILNVWVTVYEDRLNNFHFYKPKNWNAQNII